MHVWDCSKNMYCLQTAGVWHRILFIISLPFDILDFSNVCLNRMKILNLILYYGYANIMFDVASICRYQVRHMWIVSFSFFYLVFILVQTFCTMNTFLYCTINPKSINSAAWVLFSFKKKCHMWTEDHFKSYKEKVLAPITPLGYSQARPLCLISDSTSQRKGGTIVKMLE